MHIARDIRATCGLGGLALLRCAQGLPSSVLGYRSCLRIAGTDTVVYLCVGHSLSGWNPRKPNRARDGQLLVHSEQRRPRELPAIIWTVGGAGVGGISILYVVRGYDGGGMAQITFNDRNSSVVAEGAQRNEQAIHSSANDSET